MASVVGIVASSLPITCFSVALLIAIIRKILELFIPSLRQTLKSYSYESNTTIHVLIVSFDDDNLVSFLKFSLARASDPRRIMFRIQDFLSDRKKMNANTIPSELRSRVTLETKSLVTAKSTCRSMFNMCRDIKDGYVCCLMKGVTFCHGWDKLLEEAHTDENAIVSAPIGSTEQAKYVCCSKDSDEDRIRFSFRNMKVVNVPSVPSIACFCSIVFGECKMMRRLLMECSDTKDIDLSASMTLKIRALKYFIVSPTACIGVHSECPKVLPRPQHVNAQTQRMTRDFIELLDMARKKGKIHAMRGLTISPSDHECIAKYGSLDAANIALEDASEG